MRNELYSSRVRAGSRTYFFDIHKASNGNFYMDITESRKKSENEFIRNNIMIFEEDAKDFINEMIDVYSKFVSFKENKKNI